MSPLEPRIFYYDKFSLLIVTKSGMLRKLYVPFRVWCIKPKGRTKVFTWVYVDQVHSHIEFLILYCVVKEWIPYDHFRIEEKF